MELNTFIRQYKNKHIDYQEFIHLNKSIDFPVNSKQNEYNDYSLKKKKKPLKKQSKSFINDTNRNWKSEAERRAKKLLKFIIYNNVNSLWRFVTLTYANSEFSRDRACRDVQKMSERLKSFYGDNIKYISIIEYHKTGHGIHFHLLMNIPFITNETFASKFWKKGFVKIEKLKSIISNSSMSGLVRYLSKYISKDFENHKKNEKHFMASRNLVRDPLKTNVNMKSSLFNSLICSKLNDGFSEVYRYTYEDEYKVKCEMILLSKNKEKT